MRHIDFRLRSLALAIVCLLGAGIALAQGPSSIQVFMPGGTMPSRALRIILVREDGYTDTVFTDSKGKFDIATPRNRSYNYTVTIEGDKQTFDTTSANLTLDRYSPNRLTIFLRPLTNNKLNNTVLDATNFEGNIPQAARNAYKEGTDAIDAGQFDEAIRNLRRAIALYPKYARAFNDLGVIYLRLGDLDEATTSFRQAISLSKRFFHPRMNLGIVLNRQEKYKEAVEVLRPLYEENHGMLVVRLAYANALLGVEELSKSEAIYRATLESKTLTDLTKANAHFKLGVILSRQGRFADAATELEKSIALNPNAANGHLLLGGALMQVQQLEKAEQELLRAYEIAGASAGGAQLLLGHIYYTQKRYGDAQRAFEQYLKDDPSAPNVSQITQLVAMLKANLKNN